MDTVTFVVPVLFVAFTTFMVIAVVTGLVLLVLDERSGFTPMVGAAFLISSTASAILLICMLVEYVSVAT